MKNTCSINKRLNCFGNFTVIHGALLVVIVTIGAVSCNPARADDDYRSLIVTTLISTGGDVAPVVPPAPPTPGPVPLRDCPVCKGTGFITHGDGHKTPCPEDHSAAERAAHYKRIATMMGGVARARSTIDHDSLRDFPSLAKADDCQCESGGPCTCNGDCDCKECACSDCPGKTSKTVLFPVCDALGCRHVKSTAIYKGKYWYVEHGGQWSVSKDLKAWRKIYEHSDGSWKFKGPTIKPMLWQAQPLSRSPGQHSHRCGIRGCGHVWSHYPGQSHRCPSCGGLSSQNYVQINSGRSYQRPVMRQPRRMFASRGG